VGDLWSVLVREVPDEVVEHLVPEGRVDLDDLLEEGGEFPDDGVVVDIIGLSLHIIFEGLDQSDHGPLEGDNVGDWLVFFAFVLRRINANEEMRFFVGINADENFDIL
jgi:hypothetical protein